MNQGTYQLAAGMLTQINRVDVIANNLANTNTNGFKQEELIQGSFNEYLQRTNRSGVEPTHIDTILNTMPQIKKKYIKSLQGEVTHTANNFDFALNKPDKFFKIQGDNGEVFLTRDGAFHRSNGLLVNSQGRPVLDINNNVIPTEEGTFGLLVGVVQTGYDNLTKREGNLYNVLDANQIENIQDTQEHILQGFLEKSNVDSITSMVSLIQSQRHFAQLQKAIEGIGETSKAAVTTLGRA